ncbi:MAG TPA: carbohydrate kinase family protein [Actinomycetota bacterium]
MLEAGRPGLDVVGVGAFNLDCVVDLAGAAASAGTDTASLRAWVAGLCAASGAPLEWGAEAFVDEPTVRALLDRLGGAAIAWQPGGSAFNTVHALASMRLGLRLGHVGVAGRRPGPGPSGHAQLGRLGVDRAFARPDARRLGGVCVSLVEGGERTMLTHTGANAGLAGLVARHHEELAAYLAGSGIVHVTSFADAGAPPRLAALLRDVKARNPAVLVSADPGHAWSTAPTPGVERLLAAADLLLVTERELAALAGGRPAPVDEPVEGLADEELAGALRRRLGSDVTILLKRADGVTVLAAGRRPRRFAHRPLPGRLVRDATGAGDVLAAGVLAALTRDPAALPAGIALGMRLARRKLRHVGSAGHAGFARLARRCLDTLPPA